MTRTSATSAPPAAGRSSTTWRAGSTTASIEEFARVALETENPATLSGRCAVFTESDIVHLYQKGTPRERIAAGIHQAICRNYRSAIARGKEFADKMLFIGGVSQNPAVRKYLARNWTWSRAHLRPGAQPDAGRDRRGAASRRAR